MQKGDIVWLNLEFNWLDIFVSSFFDRLESPVHTYYGHSQQIIEFCWRNINPDDPGREAYQIVTYAKDMTMRIWTISQRIMEEMLKHEAIEAGVAGDGRGLQNMVRYRRKVWLQYILVLRSIDYKKLPLILIPK